MPGNVDFGENLSFRAGGDVRGLWSGKSPVGGPDVRSGRVFDVASRLHRPVAAASGQAPTAANEGGIGHVDALNSPSGSRQQAAR